MSKGEERHAEFEYEKHRKLDFQNHEMNPTQTTHDDIDKMISKCEKWLEAYFDGYFAAIREIKTK